MIKTEIQVDKPYLSINYDISTNTLIGDTQFNVSLISVGDEEPTDKTVNITHDENIIVDPDTFIGDPRPRLITVSLAPGVIVDEGAYNFSLKVNNEHAVSEENVVSSLSAKAVIEPEPEYEYKLKYYIEREKYRLNIYENVIVGTILTPIEVNGTVDLSYQDRSELVTPIISSSIKINLEASIERTFEDLYNEDEKTFKAEVIKDGKVKFLGFILPDSIWEDFVADKWNLQITASDGLSSLKNVSFSQDITDIEGNPLLFTGRLTAMNIINICLKKTGLELPINVNCQVVYNDWVGKSILSSIYLSTERYFQNDSEPMDCESVIKSIMQIFNATLIFQNGEWWIYRSLDIVSRNLVAHYEDGIWSEDIVGEFGHILGSDINNFEIYHCNENQKKTISPTVQAYQVIYQYGSAKNVLANGGLILEGTGLNIPGWIVSTAPDGLVDRGVRPGWNYGVRSAVRPLDPPPIFLSLNQSINVTQGAGLTLTIKYRNDGENSLYLNFAFSVYNAGLTTWYNLTTGNWQSGYVTNRVDNYHQEYSGGAFINVGNLDATFTLNTISPIDGEIAIHILRNGHGPGGIMGVHGIFLQASDDNVKSTDYTGRRTEKKSTAVKPNVTVYNGDSGSDLFVGTIFKDDADTPTSTWNRYVMYEQAGEWFRDNVSEQKQVLEINAADNLRISPRPMTVFEGDFKGFIPYLTFVTIDGFKWDDFGTLKDKRFQFLKYSYSFDKDETKMLLREFSDMFALFEHQYKVTIKQNFSNESKVLIIN